MPKKEVDNQISKERIAELFEQAYSKYRDKQIENLKCASIVDIDRIGRLLSAPLACISNMQSSFFNYDDSIIYSRPGYLTPNGTDTAGYGMKKKNYSLFGSLVYDYVKNNEENLPEDQLFMLIESISNAKCLSHEAYDAYKTFINYTTSDYDKNIDLAPKMPIDRIKILKNIAKADSTNLYSATLELLPAQMKGWIDSGYEMLEKFIEFFWDDITERAKNMKRVRKHIYSDFIIYNYAAYYINRIRDKYVMKHIPCGHFMYLQDYNETINFFVKAKYEDNRNSFTKEEKRVGIPALFDIYVYNYENDNYEYYTIRYTDKISGFFHKLQKRDKEVMSLITYEDIYKDLPIFLRCNDPSILYGTSEIARHYEDAMRSKINDFYLKYVSARIIRPAQNVGADDMHRVQEDGDNKIKSSPEVLKTDHQKMTSPSAVNVMNQTDANGNPMQPTALHQPMMTVLPNALETVNFNMQMSLQKMGMLFNGQDIQKAQQIEYATNSNAKKIRNDAMTKIENIAQFYGELLDMSLDIGGYDHIVATITEVHELSQLKTTTEQKKSSFLSGMVEVFSANSQLINQQHIDTGNSLEKLYILYNMLTNDYPSIVFNDKGLSDKLYTIYCKLVKEDTLSMHHYRAKPFSLKVSEGIKFDASYVLDKLQTFSVMNQLAQGAGILAAPSSNSAAIRADMLKTELGPWWNIQEMYENKLAQMQAQQQTQEQDIPREHIEAQGGGEEVPQ